MKRKIFCSILIALFLPFSLIKADDIIEWKKDVAVSRINLGDVSRGIWGQYDLGFGFPTPLSLRVYEVRALTYGPHKSYYNPKVWAQKGVPGAIPEIYLSDLTVSLDKKQYVTATLHPNVDIYKLSIPYWIKQIRPDLKLNDGTFWQGKTIRINDDLEFGKRFLSKQNVLYNQFDYRHGINGESIYHLGSLMRHPSFTFICESSSDSGPIRQVELSLYKPGTEPPEYILLAKTQVYQYTQFFAAGVTLESFPWRKTIHKGRFKGQCVTKSGKVLMKTVEVSPTKRDREYPGYRPLFYKAGSG